MNRNLLSTFLSLFFLLSCFQFQRGVSDQTVIISADIDRRIATTIVSPYRMAYETLNYRIVQRLLAVNTKSKRTTIRMLTQSLLSAAKTVRDQLHNAAKASEEIRTTIDERINQLVLSISNQEKQVRESKIAVARANLNVQYAQEQINLAEKNVHRMKQRLYDYQQNLATQRLQYDTAQAQFNAANIQLQAITSALNEHGAKQSLVISLKRHINNMWGASTILLDQVTELIDFQRLIVPLNYIYEEMFNNNIMESFGFKITAETVSQIKANLEKLNEKMSRMPLNFR
jgi:chromosome segregation ATPase